MIQYRRIEEWVISSIEQGSLRIGDKLPSESELCDRFEVSRHTVRVALGNLQAAGWTETRKGIGTFCAKSDRKVTQDIGLVVFFSGSYIFPRISRGCDQVAHRNGFHLLLNQSEYDLAKECAILDKLRKRGVDGLIIEPVFDGEGPSNVALLSEIEAQGIPVVLLDNDFPGRGFSRVGMDDRAGGALVATHLWEKGHRSIGVLYDRGYLPKRLRKEGAVEALAALGVQVPEKWVLGYQGPSPSGRALEVVSGFFARGGKRPTAIICSSDEEAMQLLKAAEVQGIRVPEELSVASFDNSQLAELPGINLTSVDHPGQHMGELATQLLLQRILNPGIASRTVSLIAPRLVERGSVRTISALAGSSPSGGGNV